MEIELYQDSDGYPRAKTTPDNKAISWYLEGDVQSNPQWINELIRLIDLVKAGNIPYWQGTGNAFTLILASDKARVESEFATPPITTELSLDELREILTAWLSLIESPKN